MKGFQSAARRRFIKRDGTRKGGGENGRTVPFIGPPYHPRRPPAIFDLSGIFAFRVTTSLTLYRKAVEVEVVWRPCRPKDAV